MPRSSPITLKGVDSFSNGSVSFNDTENNIVLWESVRNPSRTYDAWATGVLNITTR
jgi:hypothetical protein